MADSRKRRAEEPEEEPEEKPVDDETLRWRDASTDSGDPPIRRAAVRPLTYESSRSDWEGDEGSDGKGCVYRKGGAE